MRRHGRSSLLVPCAYRGSSTRMKLSSALWTIIEQTANIATLPGIVKACYVMPDAHWGYGFPIGGVAAFDADDGGIVSAGGVGFDVSCGVRTMLTGLKISEIEQVQKPLADSLFRQIPA